MKRISLALFIVGIAFLVGLVWNIGPGELWRQLRALGWGLVPFVLGEGVGELLHTRGWRWCLPRSLRSIRWTLLFRIRMAGYALNYLTPSASMGGEVTKATLLSASTGCTGTEAATGVLVEKVAMGLAHALFVAVGCLVFLPRIDLPRPLAMSMVLSGALVVFGIGTFLFLQKRGQLGALVRRLAARRSAGPGLRKAAAQITAVDDALRAFYQEQSSAFRWAVLWHLLGFSIGIVQAWLFLHILIPGASLGAGAAVCCFGMWFDLLSFAVPLNAGSQEGGRILVFRALGFSSVLGLTCGVAIRLAQLVWAGVGLALYAWLVAENRRRPAPATTARVRGKAYDPVQPATFGTE